MPLDRQSIEKRDFPIGRRGYEPDAVDAHLAAVADEVDTLQRQSRRRSSESLAQSASEQVRAIVDAAERSAADIERAAEEDAAEIRAEANEDADRTRQDAVQRAREQVGRVTEATTGMIQRIEAMRTELDGLLESLRTGANRVNADLSLLESSMGDLQSAAGEPTRAAAGRGATRTRPTPEVESFDDAEIATFQDAASEADEAEEAPTATATAPVAEAPPPRAEPEPEPEPAAEEAGEGNGDVEGARLIALNMALNGQSREETDRYLSENFDLADRESLLDEVYASVEG